MTIRQGQTVIAGLSSVVGSTDNTTVSVNGQNKVQAIGLVNKNGNSPKYDWVGTLAQYNALNSYNNDWTYFITDDNVTTNAVQNAIGQIIQVACNSSYIPDGCLPCDGTEYSRNVFGDLWTNYLVSSPARLATCTYAEYSSDISTYGQCGKFAVDTVNGMFKVPYIKDGSYLTQALSNSELGKSYNESLPSHTHDEKFVFSEGVRPLSPTYNATASTGSTKSLTQSLSKTSYEEGGILQTGTPSSSVYQNNAKVQGDNVRVRYFVVVVDGHINQSMMDWAQWTTEMSNKANLDLANTGRITNCLTHIPQDIKLELNNGVLTLKAGSKVYVPNGVGVYDVVNIENDVSTYNTVTDNTIRLCYYNRTSNSLIIIQASTSGTTTPTSAGNVVFYNTTDNTIKLYIDGVLQDNLCSFPIALIQADGTYLCGSINQVFNGFGYIGSSLFVLPGVKGLIPNGRNSDGSLNNITYTTSQVLTRLFSWDISMGGQYVALYSNNTIGSAGTNRQFYQQENEPEGLTYSYWYKPSENIMYATNAGTTWSRSDFLIYGNVIGDTTGKITSFTPKNTFNALDYNDRRSIARFGMPSDIYFDRTLTTGTYTAPAPGYLEINHESATYITVQTSGFRNTVNRASAGSLTLFTPINGGDSYTITSTTTSLSRHRFVYAVGSEP